MKPYHKNPRRITKKRHERLTDTLVRLGDLGGIVHNLETDEIIGGNQRMAVFKDGEPVIVEQYDQPDEQGTVAHGFIVWQGKRYAYRQVRWDEATAEEANIAANVGAGTWDWDALSGWDAENLQQWGFDTEALHGFNLDATNLREMLNSGVPEITPEEAWQGMPEFEQGDKFGAFLTVAVHFASQEDVDTFAELVGQPINSKMKYIWFPKLQRENLKAYQVADDAS